VPTLPKPIPFTNYGGLILNKPLDDIGSDNAMDLLDVDWDNSLSTLRSRQGAASFSFADAAGSYDVLFGHSLSRLLARRAATLLSLNTEGKEVAGKSIAISERHLAFARLGTPSASYTYIADAEGTIKRYDGADFTSPTANVGEVKGVAMPKGKFLAVWPDGGNRLVVAGTTAAGGPNGAISSGSHVWFSMPGNGEEYEGTAFVQLNPGDGEEIIGCVAFGGMIFVFKETRCFIFYGVSADADGKPVFNFRSVELGTRMRAPGALHAENVIAGSDSVYFVADHGVYATTGAEPSLLSDDLAPLSESTPLLGPILTTLGTRRWVNAAGIAYMGEALYVGLEEGGIVDRVMKFDLRSQSWTIYTAALNCLVAWNEQTNLRARIFFSGTGAGNRRIYFYTPATDDDASAAAMSPRWQSGFYELEDADEKTFVQTKIWGTGEVTIKVAEDYGDLGAGTDYVLGVAPKIAQRQKQKAQSATLFSHQISGDAPWSVQRIDRYLRESRVPETQKGAQS
jgi:hypothetical protein